MATEKKAPAKRKKKTAAELKKDLEAFKKRVADAEAKEYGAAIEAALTKQNVISGINVIKANVKGANELLILRKIGEMLGVKRLQITQSEPKPRQKKGS